jgi:hypothetical protein
MQSLFHKGPTTQAQYGAVNQQAEPISMLKYSKKSKEESMSTETNTIQEKIITNAILVTQCRGRGRKPENEKQMITAKLKEGIVMFRRGIFRRFNKMFKADTEFHEQIKNDPFYERYIEVLTWAMSTETVYENKH